MTVTGEHAKPSSNPKLDYCVLQLAAASRACSERVQGAEEETDAHGNGDAASDADNSVSGSSLSMHAIETAHDGEKALNDASRSSCETEALKPSLVAVKPHWHTSLCGQFLSRL